MSSQVKRKAAEADELIRQMAAAAQGEQAVADEPVAQEEDQQTAEVVLMQQPEGEQPDLEPSVYNEQPAISHDEIAELKEAARKADARWRSLQGQIDSKDRQIEQLHNLLANLQEAPAAQPSEQPRGWSKEDEDAFGTDMIDLVDRISESKVQGYKDRIAELERQLSSVSEVTAATVNSSFEDRLTKLSPSWESINTDPEFIDWLRESTTRQQLFQAAAQKKDAQGVAEFFNLYGQLKGLNAPAPKPDNRQKLEKQVAPGRARSTAPAAATPTPEEKFWKRSEIAEFYKSKSKYAADEFNKIEREISRAMASNRVDYTS